MSIRRSLIGLVVAGAVALSACSASTSSGAPSVAIPSIALPSLAIPSIAVPSASGLEGFCADFTSKVAAKWPNVERVDRGRRRPVVQPVGGEGGDGDRQGRRRDDRGLAHRHGSRGDRRVTAAGRRDRVRSPQGVRGLELLSPSRGRGVDPGARPISGASGPWNRRRT